MSNAWDFDSNKSTTATDGGNKKDFMKLPIGISHIRLLDEEPHVRWTHWMQQFRRSITCPGNCPIDKIRKQEKANNMEYTYSMQRKFSMNIWNHGTERIEILDEGITFMEDLRDIRQDLLDEGKNLTDVVLKIKKRAADGGKFTYRIDVDREEAMSDAELQAVAQKTDFREYFKPATIEQIDALLRVTENHAEKFVEIMTGEEKANEPVEEDIETE